MLNNYPLTHRPLATHKRDKRDRESVWVSLMKPRVQGARRKGEREGEPTTRVNNELNKTIM